MDKQQLKEKLSTYSREDIENYCISLLEQKLEIRKDLQTTGNVMVQLMKTVGVMNDKMQIEQEQYIIVKRAGALLSKAVISGQSFAEKFSFLSEAEPLLEKYKDLLFSEK